MKLIDPTDSTIPKSDAPSGPNSESSDTTTKEPPSKPWPEVVALGAQIVERLGQQAREDFLSHWMSHRVAELIKSADAAAEKEREPLKKEITSLVLTVWERVNKLCEWRCVPGPFYDPDLLKRELFGGDPINLTKEEKAVRFDRLLEFFERNEADEHAPIDVEESQDPDGRDEAGEG